MSEMNEPRVGFSSPSFMAIQAKGNIYSILESSWLERVLKTLCKTDGHSSNTLGSPEAAFRIFHDSLFLQWPMLYFLVANPNNHVATQNFPEWHSVWISLYILLHVFYKKTTKGNKNVFVFFNWGWMCYYELWGPFILYGSFNQSHCIEVIVHLGWVGGVFPFGWQS